MTTLVYVLIGINAILTIFMVFMIGRITMIMKAGTLTELLKYKQEARKHFRKKEEDDDFIY